ncbi:MAG: MarR family transcriptional regulator [Caldilineaceae bacterium]|nr:MarR family transcriptional regulator [Caldilineaceae bacterium]
MRGQTEQAALIEEFYREVSRLSTWTVVFHGAVAARLGLNPTDLKCGAVLGETGPIPAGELAALTGLTTGAITGVLDRLEKAGLVRRAADPTDRRRVIVEPLDDPARLAEIMQLLAPLSAETAQLLKDHYDNDQLRLILDFVRRSAELMRRQTTRLRAQTQEGKTAP